MPRFCKSLATSSFNISTESQLSFRTPSLFTSLFLFNWIWDVLNMITSWNKSVKGHVRWNLTWVKSSSLDCMMQWQYHRKNGLGSHWGDGTEWGPILWQFYTWWQNRCRRCQDPHRRHRHRPPPPPPPDPVSNCHAISDLFLSFSCLCFLEEKVRPFAHDHRDATSGTTQKLQSNIEFFLLQRCKMSRFLFFGRVTVYHNNGQYKTWIFGSSEMQLCQACWLEGCEGFFWSRLDLSAQHTFPTFDLSCISRGAQDGVGCEQRVWKGACPSSTNISINFHPHISKRCPKKLTNDKLHLIQLR